MLKKSALTVVSLLLIILMFSGCIVFGNKGFDDLTEEEKQQVSEALQDVEEELEDVQQELEDAFEQD